MQLEIQSFETVITCGTTLQVALAVCIFLCSPRGVVLLLFVPLAPAEIKGFWHRARVHVGMPWHMFETERNM